MGAFIRLDKTPTDETYVSTLSDHLHSFLSIVNSNGLGEFQQGNATPNKSRIATEMLQKHFSLL